MSASVGGPVSFMAAHPGLSVDELARKYLRAATQDDLLPLIRDVFRNVERSQTRALEVSKDIQRLLASPMPRAPKPLSEENRKIIELLGQAPYRFAGSSKRFAAMTVQDHRERIRMLSVQQAGLARSIQIHQRAIELIEAQKVTCLDEIAEEVELAAAA